MNAPITTKSQIQPIFLELITEVPLCAVADISDGRLTPLEADVLREEEEERAKRTATPWEVFQTLKQSNHHHLRASRELAMETLADWEWPEEQRQIVDLNGPYEMKLFKGPDGFIVKWTPILSGGRADSEGVTWELFRLKV